MQRKSNIAASIKPVHPFPARMAAEIAFDELSKGKKNLKVLDPMVGSGTTIAVASRRGHNAVGFDMDPLAVLMTNVWCSKADSKKIEILAKKILEKSKNIARTTSAGFAYPSGGTDEETKAFIRYWFDSTNRIQLYALAKSIRRIRNANSRNILWCAFSRMIIKKKDGVSLAMDVSHSRPHKVGKISRYKAFDLFGASVKKLMDSLNASDKRQKAPRVQLGDARKLRLKSTSIDIVITSPPYLNAIDYLRGHRLSLVWMDYSIPQLRKIRTDSIGSETKSINKDSKSFESVIDKMCNRKRLPARLRAILERYLLDLHLMLIQIFRVLKNGGRAIFVIGNSSTQGVFVKNSIAIAELSKALGFKLKNWKIRKLPANRRYLPPPSSNSGIISNRMRTETMLTFVKPAL